MENIEIIFVWRYVCKLGKLMWIVWDALSNNGTNEPCTDKNIANERMEKKLRPLDTHDENNFAQKNVLICKDWNSNLKFAHQIAAHRNPTHTYSDCVSLVHGHFSNPTETFFFCD